MIKNIITAVVLLVSINLYGAELDTAAYEKAIEAFKRDDQAIPSYLFSMKEDVKSHGDDRELAIFNELLVYYYRGKMNFYKVKTTGEKSNIDQALYDFSFANKYLDAIANGNSDLEINKFNSVDSKDVDRLKPHLSHHVWVLKNRTLFK